MNLAEEIKNKPVNRGMSFSFAWMTKNKRYSLAKAEKLKGNAASILEALFEELTLLSQTSLDALKNLNKYDGGFETLPLDAMKGSIIDSVPADRQKEIHGLLVFRFDKEKYRLICASLPEQPNLLYVLGFDLDYTLYNHGS